MLKFLPASFKKRPFARMPIRESMLEGELFARNLAIAVEHAESAVTARRIFDEQKAERVRHFCALGLLKACSEGGAGSFKSLAEQYVREFLVWSLQSAEDLSRRVGVHEDIRFQQHRLAEVVSSAKTRLVHSLAEIASTSTPRSAKTLAVYLGLTSGMPGLYEERAARTMGISVAAVLSIVDTCLSRTELKLTSFELLVALELVAVFEGTDTWVGFIEYATKDPYEIKSLLKKTPRIGSRRLVEEAERIKRQRLEVTQLELELRFGLPDGWLTEWLKDNRRLRIKLFGRDRPRLNARSPNNTLKVRRGVAIPRNEVAARLREIAAERHGDAGVEEAEDSLETLFGSTRMSAKRTIN